MLALEAAVRAVVGGIDGCVGVCIRDYETGREIGVNLDEPLPMASVCKAPILVEAFRRHDAGEFDLRERVVFTADRRTLGSGLFNAFDPGFQPTLHDCLLMMIVVSDNAATDLVLERLTPERVTATMRDLGLDGIRVDRSIRRLIGDILAAIDPVLDTVAFDEWPEFRRTHPELAALCDDQDLDAGREAVNVAAADRDVATPRHMARLFELIAKKACASEASCDDMLDILAAQQLNGRLPRDLPGDARLPHKTGTLGSGAVVNDAGILYIRDTPVASIAMLSRDVRDPIYRTNTAIARIGRAVYDHYAA
jgi:beta-lactamase class A